MQGKKKKLFQFKMHYITASKSLYDLTMKSEGKVGNFFLTK